MTDGPTERYEAADVKAAVRDWPEILSAAGIPRDSLDGQHHACPKCGGSDRFRLLDAQAGAVICNACFAKGNGDGFAAVQWIMCCSFPIALQFVAEQCGMQPINVKAQSAGPVDVLTRVAREKRVTPESLQAYGAVVDGGAVVLPMFDGDGKQCSTFTMRPGGDKGKCARGKPAGVFLPIASGEVLKGEAVARAPQAGETWHIVEGGKDSAALHGLGLLAMGMPTCRLNSKFIPLLRGVNVVFIPDRDTAGDEGAQQSAGRLFRAAASVKIAALPAEMKPSDGADVRDILAMPDGERLVREAIDNALPWQPEMPGDGTLKPEVKIGPDEHRMTDQTIAELAKRGDMFQRGGMLVEVRENPPPPPGIIRPDGGIRAVRVPRPRLREQISATVEFTKLKKTDDGDEWVATHVPQTVVDQIDVRGEWPGMPSLEGVVTSPQFLADGSILAVPGYNAHSGLYFAADCKFSPIADRPTIEDAKAACDSLLEVVADFPISEVGKAAWLSIVLTVAARHAIDGPTPLFSFDANVRGSGKSKAADAIGMIHTGRELPRSNAASENEEFRKMITSTLLAAEPVVLLDNVAGALGCPALDALLTSSTWTDRVLGASQMTAAMPAKAVWMATGNNLAFAADTARRTLRIRLESPLENPEERTGFRHPNLLAWVKQERGRLAADAVTILRAWHCARRPDMGLAPWGSFEAWSKLIRNPIVWLGLPDPGSTRQEVQRESDREAGLLRQLLDAWEQADPNHHGMTVVDAIGRAERGEEQSLVCVIAELTGPNGKPSARSIGMKLHHLRGRVCGGKFFEKRDSHGTAIWFVNSAEKVVSQSEQGGTSGTSWTISNPSRASFDNIDLVHAHVIETKGGRAGISPTTATSPTSSPITSACNHLSPSSWIEREGVLHCPGCDKFMGRARQVT